MTWFINRSDIRGRQRPGSSGKQTRGRFGARRPRVCYCRATRVFIRALRGERTRWNDRLGESVVQSPPPLRDSVDSEAPRNEIYCKNLPFTGTRDIRDERHASVPRRRRSIQVRISRDLPVAIANSNDTAELSLRRLVRISERTFLQRIPIYISRRACYI